MPLFKHQHIWLHITCRMIGYTSYKIQSNFHFSSCCEIVKCFHFSPQLMNTTCVETYVELSTSSFHVVSVFGMYRLWYFMQKGISAEFPFFSFSVWVSWNRFYRTCLQVCLMLMKCINRFDMVEKVLKTQKGFPFIGLNWTVYVNIFSFQYN